jgi:hypothetical protein
MTLRSDIHAALDVVVPAAPHLPATVVDAVLAAPPPRPRWRRAVILGLTGTAAIVVLAVMMLVGLGLLPGQVGRPAPATTPQPRPVALVITKWVRDPSVVNGPWPGYRPQIAYRGTLASVNAARDPNGGGDWVLDFTFDAQGAQAFASLTTEAVAACPDTGCPEGHLTNWLGLTEDDIDHWNERANTLYWPASEGGKLLADPIVQTPITGGQGYIRGNFSREAATDLAHRLGGK